MSKRDSFIFYRSFFEATKPLKKNEKAELFDAICNYALDQKSTELKPLAKAMFALIQPQLEANYKKFLNGKKPKQKESKTEAKYNQDISKTEGNVNDNVNTNDNVNDNGVHKGAHLFKNSEYFDLEKFIDCFDLEKYGMLDLEYYYESVRDWSASKDVKRKDWIATARGFIRKDKDSKKLKLKGNGEIKQSTVELLNWGSHLSDEKPKN